jgi:uncharacterized protein (DUF2225 family)
LNILAGLEKFGLDISKGNSLFEDESKGKVEGKEGAVMGEKIPKEEELLLEKLVECTVCGNKFKTKMIKSGRVRRKDPDEDLRPRFYHIDTLKYDIISCPVCGYTALNRYFERLSTTQIRLIREEISMKFNGAKSPDEPIITYEKAIERYKLALINTIVKRGKDSEKAYICLKIAWLLRGKAETMPENTDAEKKAKIACKEQEEAIYRQAYEGFIKASSREGYPLCGMDQNTVDYLLAYMSYHFGKFELASRYLSTILTSSSTSRRMKDHSLPLKEKVMAELRKKKKE